MSDDNRTDDEVLTVPQAAALLQVGTNIVYRLANDGEIPARKVGGVWRFSRLLIHLWLVGDYQGTLMGDQDTINAIRSFLIQQRPHQESGSGSTAIAKQGVSKR